MAGHITKRRYPNRDGTATVRWRARYPNPNPTYPGHQIEQLFGTRREAEQWLIQQQAGVLTGTHIAPSEGERRFRELYETWRSTRWSGLEPTTRSRYGQVWRTYLEPEFGNRKVASITRELVRRYFARLTDEGRAPGTVRKVHAVMSAIMSEGVELGYVKVNPCLGVKGLPKPEHREMLFLEADEVRAVAEAITPYYRTLVYVAAYTGLRASELCGLRLRNLDLLHGKLTVAEALKEVDGKLVFGPPKTHEQRTISLPHFLCEMLNDHLAASPGGTGPDALVFRGPQGGPLRHHLFYRRHYKPAVRAALPAEKHGLRFHDLRHTCASLLIAQGAHPKLIQARLGHSSITITLDRYGHLFPSLEAALADKLDAAFAAGAEPVATVAELGR